MVPLLRLAPPMWQRKLDAVAVDSVALAKWDFDVFAATKVGHERVIQEIEVRRAEMIHKNKIKKLP